MTVLELWNQTVAPNTEIQLKYLKINKYKKYFLFLLQTMTLIVVRKTRVKKCTLLQ